MRDPHTCGGRSPCAPAAVAAADEEHALAGDDRLDSVGGEQPPAAEHPAPQRQLGHALVRMHQDAVDDRAAATAADAEPLAVRQPVGEDGAALRERLLVVDGSGHGPAVPGKAPTETCGELRKPRRRRPHEAGRMTETNTRDGLTLLFAALAVLVPTCLLLVVAICGGGVPQGAEIALFAIPAALMAGCAVTGAKLFSR